MSGFYVSLIFIGILLVLFSLVCVFLDKKKVFHFSRNFEDKKQELVEIINDAEQMIEELNKFSGYIVNQMDLKNEELCKNMKDAEGRVNALNSRAKTAADEYAAAFSEAAVSRISAAAIEAPAVRNTVVAAGGVFIPAAEEYSMMAESAAEGSNLAVNSGITYRKPSPKFPYKKNDKVIPINNKYSEVIRLSQEGLYSLEIAKKLNMGKGEVELILGLRK